MIPFNQASIGQRELDLLAEALKLGHISGNGPTTAQAERLLESVHGSGRSLLTTSCTHALEMSARLLRLEPGDEIIVPSFTFVSTAGAFLLHGGRPVFVDVREDTLNIDFEQARDAISPRTKAICVVHYAGVAAEPDRFAELCNERGIALIEDNAHGLFGSFRGRPLGTFGSMSTMSFHETKNITCGEGGALHVNAEELIERAEILREKGTDRSRFFRGEVDKYTWVDVGSSWVLSDLLAGVLLGQLERRERIQARRATIWSRYASELSDWASMNGVRLPSIPEGANHPAHLFHLRLRSGSDRSRFIESLKRDDVHAVFHYQALNLSDVGRSLGGRRGQCPVTEEAADTLVRLPLHLGMSDSDIDRVVSNVVQFTSE